MGCVCPSVSLSCLTHLAAWLLQCTLYRTVLKRTSRSFNWSRMRAVMDMLWYTQVTLLLHELHWLWFVSGHDSKSGFNHLGLSLFLLAFASLIWTAGLAPSNLNNVINQNWKNHTSLLTVPVLWYKVLIKPTLLFFRALNAWLFTQTFDEEVRHFASFHLPSIISNYCIVISFEFCGPPRIRLSESECDC